MSSSDNDIKRSKVSDEVEKLLLRWINEKQLAEDRVSEAMICTVMVFY